MISLCWCCKANAGVLIPAVTSCVLVCVPGGQLYSWTGGGNDGVSDRVRTTATLLGTGWGLPQAVVCSAPPTAHFHCLWLEDLLWQVTTWLSFHILFTSFNISHLQTERVISDIVTLIVLWLSSPCRSDTVRYALDILSILTVVPKTQLLLSEAVAVLDEGGSTVSTVGRCYHLTMNKLYLLLDIWGYLKNIFLASLKYI